MISSRQQIKNHLKSEGLWLFSSVIGIACLYLNLIWKTTANIDLLTTNSFYWGAIIWLLWRRKDQLRYYNEPIASFIGLLLVGLILSKTFTYAFGLSLLYCHYCLLVWRSP